MPDILVNIMDQYRPENETDPNSSRFNPGFRELARKPSREELMEVYGYARDLRLDLKLISFEKRVGIRYLGDDGSLVERFNEWL